MSTHACQRLVRGSAFLGALLFSLQTDATAQSTRFTVDDLLDLTNASLADITPDGKLAIMTTAAMRDRIGIDNSRFGDPTYVAPSVADVWVVETATGKSARMFPDKRQVGGFRWAPDARTVAFFAVRNGRPEPMLWDRASGKTRAIKLPADRVLADGAMQWSADSRTLLVPLRDAGWTETARKRFAAITTDSIIVQAGKDSFLAWDDLGRLRLEQSLALYDVANDRVREVVPRKQIRSYDLSADGSFITYQQDITKKTDYDVIGGNDNELIVQQTGGGEPRKLFPSTRGMSLQWSRDGRRYAYSKEGAIFVGTIDGGEAKKLLGPAARDTTAQPPQPRPAGDRPPATDRFSVVRMAPSGSVLIASNSEGFWFVDTSSGDKELFLKSPPEEDRESPRYSVVDITPDAQSVYLTYAARTKWERGIFRYDRSTKQLKELVRDGRIYSGVRLSRDGSTVFYSIAEGNRPAQMFAADPDLQNPRPLMDTHASLRSKELSRTGLIEYYDADGKKSYGVLYYPVGYETGKRYPVIFNIYETFFDDSFNATINVLTANGYAVVQPSVNLEQGYPGEAWVKGVTAAANKLIEMGIADPDRLGVQGTSYGGYATNLLITQTDRFKAAINISGKTDMISFYTDSPRLGVRNTHAPEKSQDRLGATLWQAPQKYIEHSAVFAADRIKTPLLLITGREDHNVPERTTMEMYYALRRLGKEVEWVSYTYGGHGMPTTSVSAVKDYHARILGWYDRWLKAPAKKVTTE